MFEIIQGDSIKVAFDINEGAELINYLEFTSEQLQVFNKKLNKITNNIYELYFTSEETENVKISNATYNLVAFLKDGTEQTIIFNDAINIKLKEPIVNYVTKEDFLKFSGKDLELEFRNGNYDIADAVPLFINRVETVAIELLKDRYDNENIEEKINNNLEQFKKGMLWQINHILDNSELYLSEFNQSKYLNDVALSIWRNIGLCNLRRF